jgi:hypothetical protein
MTLPLFTRNENNGVFDFSNLIFIPQGLSHYDLWTEFGNGAATVCDEMRALIGHDCSPEFAEYGVIHKKATFRGVALPLFQSMYNMIKHDYALVDTDECKWSEEDKQAVKNWYKLNKNNEKKLNWKLARQYALELYRKQRGLCARTRIPIKPYPCPRQASVDRIDNSRPHVPGNLRLVVLFANAHEQGEIGDKMKAKDFAQYVSLA